MKKCTYCGKELGDELNICPFDNGPLQIIAEKQQHAGNKEYSPGFKGIGTLETSQSASSILVTSNIFKGIFAVCGFMLMLPAAKDHFAHRDSEDIILVLGGIGLILVLGGIGACCGIDWLVKRRLYRVGDWYMQLEHSANAEKHDVAKEAAHRLLELTGTDLTTSKLKAKAHLYLAYYQSAELGAGHWEPLIALLNTILEQEPGNPVFRLDRGQAYHKIGKYDEGLRDLDLLVADTEHPNLRAYSLKISCLTAAKRLDEAKCACAELETLRSRFPDITAITDALAAHKAEIDVKLQQGTNSKPATPNA